MGGQIDNDAEDRVVARERRERAEAEEDQPSPAQLFAGSAEPSSDPVEQAYREGKFPKERCRHYYMLLAKNPRKTKRLLASLEPVLTPPEVMAEVDSYLEAQPHTAPVAAAAPAPSGPTAYPKGWLRPGEVVPARAFGGAGSIMKEEATGVAGPGEVL